MSRPARGQSTVELALGLLLFVPILLLGIHFAEIGVVKLRVTQAANSALWDTTGLRMHRFDTAQSAAPRFYNFNQLKDGSGRLPAARARALYKDFDGLSTGGTARWTQALTRASGLSVSCTPSLLAPMPTAARFAPLKDAYANPTYRGDEVDGMACSAEATVQTWNLPTHFAEDSQGGFFDTAMVHLNAFKVCAFGRARNGECKGSVPIALDDWALSGSDPAMGQELSNCAVPCLFEGTGNQAYKRTVGRIYDRYNRFALADLSIPDFIRALFTRSPAMPELFNVPVDERTFRFAFVGEEGSDGTDPFKLRTREQDTFTTFDFQWATTPAGDAYGTAYNKRGECFLGSKCTRSVFAKGP